jgi:hypothetical protein
MLSCHARGRLHRLMAGHLLPTHAMLAMLHQAVQVLSSEANVLRLSGPITVVGSVQGQFVDLLNMLLISTRPLAQHRMYTRRTL